MLRSLQQLRWYCKFAAKSEVNKLSKINYKELKHTSKVPAQPIKQEYDELPVSEIDIDTKTIQLLERLSLVDLDSKQALDTLKSSIEFAHRITHIDTEGVAPLYTVLEAHNLPLREDRVTEGDCREEILRNAKVTDEDYFVSPPGNIPLEQEEKDYSKE